MIFGFYQDVFRVEILEKARAAHPHGLLVCRSCGFSWLTIETAKIGYDGTVFDVQCMNEFDCVRRGEMNMFPLVEKKAKGRKVV